MEGSARRTATRIAMVLTAALSAASLAYLGVLWQTVRGIDAAGSVSVGHLRPLPIARADASGTNPVFQGQNLLIVGNDDRSGMTDAEVRQLRVGRDGGSLNTDSMLIVHIPADGSRATLISLPRDSYVHIPGHGMNRLNAAYGYGYSAAHGDLKAHVGAGGSLLTRVVEQLTGVPIDHFVQVSLLGFVRISNAIGDVPINLCNSVDDTVAHNRANGLHGGSGFQMSKGFHKIHGVQALEFVRQRENLEHSDLDRAARQRYFLTSAFRSVMSAGTLLDLGRLRRLIDAVRNNIYADSGLNLLDLAKQLSTLSADKITGHAIPTDHYWHTSPVGDVGIVRPRAVRRYVTTLLSAHPGRRPATGRGHRARPRKAADSGCIN